MTDTQTDCRQLFWNAIRKAAQDNPELAPDYSGNTHTPEECYEMMATFTADGDGGLLVFLAGRKFAGKVLENIPNPDSYEVCALIREAIEHKYSIRDNGGTVGLDFYTPAHECLLRDAYIQVAAEPA